MLTQTVLALMCGLVVLGGIALVFWAGMLGALYAPVCPEFSLLASTTQCRAPVLLTLVGHAGWICGLVGAAVLAVRNRSQKRSRTWSLKKIKVMAEYHASPLWLEDA